MRWKELLIVMSVVAFVAWFGTKPTYGGQVSPTPPTPTNYFQDEPRTSQEEALPSSFSKDPNPLTHTEVENRQYFVEDSQEAPYVAMELSARQGESFADTEFRVKVRAAVPTDLQFPVDGGLPSTMILIARQGDREWNLSRAVGDPTGQSASRRYTPPLPAGYQAEWSVVGSEMRANMDVRGIPDFEAGPVEFTAVFMTSDPNSSRFSRGSAMLTYTSAPVVLNF